MLIIDEAYGLYGGRGSQGTADDPPKKNAMTDTTVVTFHSIPGEDRCVYFTVTRTRWKRCSRTSTGTSVRGVRMYAIVFAIVTVQDDRTR